MDQRFLVKEQNLTIRMPEEIDHHQAVYISEMADFHILKDDVTNVIFDFENTSFMDSSGIGIIVGRHRKISCIGGKVYVVHANKRMQKMLYMSGILGIVELIDD